MVCWPEGVKSKSDVMACLSRASSTSAHNKARRPKGVLVVKYRYQCQFKAGVQILIRCTRAFVSFSRFDIGASITVV